MFIESMKKKKKLARGQRPAVLPRHGGGEREAVLQVPEPGRVMDSHVAGVRARPSRIRLPASGPFGPTSLSLARLRNSTFPVHGRPAPGLRATALWSPPLQAETGGELSRVDS